MSGCVSLLIIEVAWLFGCFVEVLLMESSLVVLKLCFGSPTRSTAEGVGGYICFKCCCFYRCF